MRLIPNHLRLRIIALSAWVIGGWWLLQPGIIAQLNLPRSLAASGALIGVLVLAIGVAFWLLAADRRAAIIFDSKGLMLNLGHSAAFVAWENIAAVGVSNSRRSLFALGSKAQLGITLHDTAVYLQTYEARLPASQGLLAGAVGLLQRAISGRGEAHEPRAQTLEALCRQTGYHLLVPEAQLGGSVEETAVLIEAYRANPARRRALQISAFARCA